MGRLLLVFRLAARDLRRRPAEAVMVLVVIATATTTLTVGLALRGVTDNPYRQTRVATAGPDVVASFPFAEGGHPDAAAVDTILHTPGVTGHSGPYPLAYADIQARGHTMMVQAEGRDLAPAAIDQPKVTQGGWVRPGEVVLDRAFAAALGVQVGDQVTLGGRPFRIAGTAVTAGLPAYPSNLCHLACDAPMSAGPFQGAPDLGLLWLTTPDAESLATATSPLRFYLNLKLADPAAAPAFVAANNPSREARIGGSNAPILLSWQSIRDADNGVVQIEQAAMQFGGWLLALLAIAGMAVLAGRRMVEQTRRVGLLKAVGGTPGLVAAVLLAEHLALALLAAAVGLLAGRLVTPLLTSTGAGLVGTPGAPALTSSTIGLVAAVAVAVAVAATLVPALRAARTSTVSALADAARPPRRRAWLIAISARLPVPLLLGLRLVARRPGRGALNALSIAVTVTGIVTILASFAFNDKTSSGVGNLRTERLNELTAIITIMLIVMAAANTIFVTWATVLDARHTSALARAFGATPQQVSAGMSAAQLLPALPAAVVGLPIGIYLYRAITQHQAITVPPLWQLLAVLLGTLLAVIVLTAIPTQLGARRSVSEILQSETA
jgi:ABC-type antimicrobial peptide transport system permease subunit